MWQNVKNLNPNRNITIQEINSKGLAAKDSKRASKELKIWMEQRDQEQFWMLLGIFETVVNTIYF